MTAPRWEELEKLPFAEVGRTTASGSGPTAALREVLGHRELLGLLVRRELKARYKDSSLGFAWSLIRPLALLLVYFIAIGQFLGAARGTPDFGIFVFAGLTIWGLYSESVSASTLSILGNAGLIKKVYLPREIFPLAAVGSVLVNFGIQFAVLITAVLVTGRFGLSWNLVYVPVALLLVLIFGIGIGLLLAAVNVYLRDTQYLVEIALMLFFWASPIVYPWSFVVTAAEDLKMPWIESAYLLNPITVAVMAFQKGLWVAGSETSKLNGVTIPPQPWPADLDLRLLVLFVVGLLFIVVAQRVFQRLQGNFAQEL